jgi:ketosteroid isomerase-like protein
MPTESDTAAIQAANDAFYTAFSSLDIERMSEVWAHEDAVKCVHPGWTLLEGWDAVQRSWQQIFSSTVLMQFTITGTSINIEGDWAWVVCTENLTSIAGTQVSEGRVQATNIYRNRAGRWLLVYHQGSLIV